MLILYRFPSSYHFFTFYKVREIIVENLYFHEKHMVYLKKYAKKGRDEPWYEV
jgi:hypothetical protein